MTAYTRTKPGIPDQGRYEVNDTVTDSNGVVWTCVKAGFATGGHAFGYADEAKFTGAAPGGVSTSVVGIGAVVAGAASYVTATEAVFGAVHKTLLTITALPQAVVNGTEYVGTQLYTFPEGRLSVLGCQATLAQTTTSALISTLNGSSTGALALGSAAASSTTLNSTMADFAPSTAFTSSATINVAGTAVNPVLASAAQIDGHTTPVSIYLNSAYATTTDVDADATQTWTGTIRIVWINLGDF